MKKNSLFKRSKGFSLLEMTLVIAILLVVIVLDMKKNTLKIKELEAQTIAHQINTIGNAVERYMLKHATALKAMNDPNCPSTGNRCVLNFNALIDDGDLPSNSLNKVQLGGGYVINILRLPPPTPTQANIICGTTNPNPIGCPDQSGNVPLNQWKLLSFIITTESWSLYDPDNQSPRVYGGMAVSELESLGAVSGYKAHTGFLRGYKKGFYYSIPFTMGLPGFIEEKEAQLVYIGGKDFNVWNNFLKKDGTNQMTGPLDMGGYKILNMRDMFINGSPTNPRNKNLSSLLPNWVFKGVYTVPKGTFGPGGENADDYIPPFIPAPICGNGGQPKIKVLTQLMKGTSANYYQFDRFVMNSMDTAIAQYSSGAITDQQYHDITQSILKDRKAKRAMQTWAVPRTPFTGWDVYIKEWYRQTDADTQIGRLGVYGEGLAELYCYYPDQ